MSSILGKMASFTISSSFSFLLSTYCSFLLLLSSVVLVDGELTLEIFANSALVRPSKGAQQQLVHNLSHVQVSNPNPLDDTPFSARILGMLSLGASKSKNFAFHCSFRDVRAALVWVDDHLVCQTGLYNITNDNRNLGDGTIQNPLLLLRKNDVVIRVHAWGKKKDLSLSVRWALNNDKNSKNEMEEFQDIHQNLTRTVASIPLPEKKRMELAERTARGWGPWIHHSLLEFVLLPDGAKISINICRVSTSDCIDRAIIGSDNSVRPIAPISSNFSIVQYHVHFQDVAVVVGMSAGKKDELLLLVETIDCLVENCSDDYKINFQGSFAYGPTRSGVVQKESDTKMTLSPTGLGRRIVCYLDLESRKRAALSSMYDSHDMTEQLTVPLPPKGEAAGLSTSSSMSVIDIKAALEMEVKKQFQYHKREYGNLAEVTIATQAAMLFNLIYTPTEVSVFAPVSRGWDFTMNPVSSDLGYVIFGWDNLFAAYILATFSKDLAYSGLIQAVRSKTSKGFIPNFSAGGIKSQDRTEPPVGARVLEEIYQKYKEIWIVELLWEDLADYMDWFFRERILPPEGLVALGSNEVRYKDKRYGAHSMQGARFESGLDNSPMYDGEFFNLSSSLMQMYDVGMTSMVISECDILARLASIIGREDASKQMKIRADMLRSKVADGLWDERDDIFTNKFQNGTFYRRRSPTSFYPLMANVATDSHATLMVEQWLLNKTRFCISPTWPISDNSDECYWGLPSISADDPAFPKLGYWRGYVWGPMAMLTYWSLNSKQYAHLDTVQIARRSLSRQMTSMFLQMWKKHGHVCENYSPHRDAKDCTGDRYYTWGALAGMTSILEEGHFIQSLGEQQKSSIE